MVGMNPTMLTSPLGAPRAPLSLRDWSLAVWRGMYPTILTSPLGAPRAPLSLRD
jgi:hypothetical protein